VRRRTEIFIVDGLVMHRHPFRNRLGLVELRPHRHGDEESEVEEGQAARDYDLPSPCRGATSARDECRIITGTNRTAMVDTSATATLGEYRYTRWNGGSNGTVYVQDGSFVKLREVSLTYAVPASFTQRVLGSRFSDVRVNLTGRNLATWTKYWGADPEVNNFGSNNVGRFVDLAPFPPAKNVSFGIDFGF
jgi:hypothetical protein